MNTYIPTIQLTRLIIAFSWIYHGVFPKLLHIAPLEQAISGSVGLSQELTYLMIKTAGVAEMIFGIVLFLFYRHQWLIKLNIFALLCLLTYVAVMQSHILIEAFNPITTNLPLIVLSLVLLSELNNNTQEPDLRKNA